MRGESISSREEWGFILAVLGRRPKANDFSLHIAKEPPGGQKTGTKKRRVGGGCASAPVSLGRIYEAGCLLLFKGTVLVLAGGEHGSGGRDGLRFYRVLIDDATMETVLDALVRAGRLTEAAALHHPTVEAALVQVIADMGARWLR